MADVLQQMVKSCSEIKHPADDNLPCPVLQYADDTLIVLRADTGSARKLKEILDSFSAATGLKINYNKSTINCAYAHLCSSCDKADQHTGVLSRFLPSNLSWAAAFL